MPVELETIIASTAGGAEFGYPDIEREVQQLNDVVKVRALAFAMIRTVPDDEHQRRRVYFALHDLALKLYALEPNDRMIGYILGLIDERERHEKEIYQEQSYCEHHGASEVRSGGLEMLRGADMTLMLADSYVRALSPG